MKLLSSTMPRFTSMWRPCRSRRSRQAPRRAELIAGVEVAEAVKQQLKHKMDLWQTRSQRMAQGSRLGYETKRDGATIGLLRRPSLDPWDEFTCLNSLR